MGAHRVVEPGAHALLDIARRFDCVPGQLPVPSVCCARFWSPEHPRAGLELPNITEWRGRGRDVAQLEVLVECVPIQLPSRQTGRDQGLELRCEGNGAAGLYDVERFDSE